MVRLVLRRRRRPVRPIEIGAALAFMGVVFALSLSGGSSGDRELMAAVRADDVFALQRAIDDGADPLWTDTAGGSLLHTAAYGNHRKVAALLLERGLPIDLATHAGETPLHAAARGGHAPMIAWLLERGADPGRRTGAEVLTCDGHTVAAGSTALDIARAAGDVASVDVLLAHASGLGRARR